MCEAETTLPADAREPRGPHPVADAKEGAVRADALDDAHDLVSGNHVLAVDGKVALGDVQISSTHATGEHAES
jgi:hypothetical protein